MARRERHTKRGGPSTGRHVWCIALWGCGALGLGDLLGAADLTPIVGDSDNLHAVRRCHDRRCQTEHRRIQRGPPLGCVMLRAEAHRDLRADGRRSTRNSGRRSLRHPTHLSLRTRNSSRRSLRHLRTRNSRYRNSGRRSSGRRSGRRNVRHPTHTRTRNSRRRNSRRRNVRAGCAGGRHHGGGTVDPAPESGKGSRPADHQSGRHDDGSAAQQPAPHPHDPAVLPDNLIEIHSGWWNRTDRIVEHVTVFVHRHLSLSSRRIGQLGAQCQQTS